MKLSKEQIAKIDETLVLNKVVYDDIKLELTDHIASDIEEIMMNQEITFGVALKEAFEKWNEPLSVSTDITKLYYGVPKIIKNKINLRYKKMRLYTGVLSICTMSLIVLFMKVYGDTVVIDFVQIIYQILLIMIPVLLFVGRKVLDKSKIETTFKIMFKAISIMLIFFMIQFSLTFLFRDFSKSFNRNLFIDFICYCSLFIPLIELMYSFTLFLLLYKHFEFERKLSKV